MNTRDPIVDEIHRLRAALADAQGGDLRKMALAARAVGEAIGRRLETLPPRRIPSTKIAS